MFVSTRDQGRRRRSHAHGVSKLAWSSKISLLSAITANSTGSSGSTSTITQDSYVKSRSGSTRRRKSTKRKKDITSSRNSSMTSNEKPEVRVRGPRNSVDVFTFLVKDEEKEVISLPNDGLESPSTDGDGDYSTGPHSFSGISMDDGNYGTLSSNPTPPLPTLPEDTSISLIVDSKATRYNADWKWPDVPKPSPLVLPPYDCGCNIGQTCEHTHLFGNEDSPRSDTSQSKRREPPPIRSKPDLSGYDLVAAKLAGTDNEPLPAVFKRFRKVNYRVLLQLQDEIIEMEDELAQLDMADTRSRHNHDGSTTPASRRLSRQWSQSDLQGLRLEVLGRLYIKLEQYYQALISAQKVKRLCSNPQSRNIEQFRRWLKDKKPLSPPESHFLDDDDDLLSLDVPLHDSPIPQRWHTPYLIPIITFSMSIIPLSSFKFFTDILDRLLILAFLLTFTCWTTEKISGTDQRRLEARQWAMACTGITIVAAILF